MQHHIGLMDQNNANVGNCFITPYIHRIAVKAAFIVSLTYSACLQSFITVFVP